MNHSSPVSPPWFVFEPSLASLSVPLSHVVVVIRFFSWSISRHRSDCIERGTNNKRSDIIWGSHRNLFSQLYIALNVTESTAEWVFDPDWVLERATLWYAIRQIRLYTHSHTQCFHAPITYRDNYSRHRLPSAIAQHSGSSSLTTDSAPVHASNFNFKEISSSLHCTHDVLRATRGQPSHKDLAHKTEGMSSLSHAFSPKYMIISIEESLSERQTGWSQNYAWQKTSTCIEQSKETWQHRVYIG